MDPLIELPYNEWWKLRNEFGTSWPENIVPFNMLDMDIKNPGLVEDFGLKVYCPEGNLSNGMIATSLRDNYYQVIIHPMSLSSQHPSALKIKQALSNTKLIDWNRNIIVPAATDTVIECLEEVKPDLGVNVFYNKASRAYKHIWNFKDLTLEEVNELKYDFTLPPNTYIGHLKSQDIDLVDKTWTYHSDHTYSYFKTLIKYNLVHVLYSELDDKPLAWICIDNYGALTHLFCLEEHRSKGYAEIITKYALNALLVNGQSTVAFTLEDNVNPKRLFKKLRCQNMGYDHWLFVTKKKNN